VTLILGVEDPANHRAILCCDSGAWSGNIVDRLRTPKIWRDGSFIVGGSGQWAHVQSLREVMIPEPPADSAREAVEAIIVSWARDVAEHLAKISEVIRRGDAKAEPSTGTIVVAHRGWVWEVLDCAVVSTERGLAVAGMVDYALGAHAMAMHTDEDRTALELAEGIQRAVYGITRNTHPPWRWMGTDGAGGMWE
jgi:hypothetical protein